MRKAKQTPTPAGSGRKTIDAFFRKTPHKKPEETPASQQADAAGVASQGPSQGPAEAPSVLLTPGEPVRPEPAQATQEPPANTQPTQGASPVQAMEVDGDNATENQDEPQGKKRAGESADEPEAPGTSTKRHRQDNADVPAPSPAPAPAPAPATAPAPASPERICLSSSSSQSEGGNKDTDKSPNQQGQTGQAGASSHAGDAAESAAAQPVSSQVYQQCSSQPPAVDAAAQAAADGPATQGPPGGTQGAATQGTPRPAVPVPSGNTYTLSDLAAMIEGTKGALEHELLLPQPSSDGKGSNLLTPDWVASFIEGRRDPLSALLTTASELLHTSSSGALSTTITTATAVGDAQAMDCDGPGVAGEAGAQEPAAAGASAASGEDAAATAAGQEASATGAADGSAGDQSQQAGDAMASLREQILCVAVRKSYGAKEALLDPVAATEDTDPDMLWFWELRDVKKAWLPSATAAMAPTGTQAATQAPATAAKPSAAATRNKKMTEMFRKRRKDLHERLSAAATLHTLLTKAGLVSTNDLAAPAAGPASGATPGAATQTPGPTAADGACGGSQGGDPTPGPATQPSSKKGSSKALLGKISKLVAKLDKLPTVEQVESTLEAGLTSLGDKDSSRVAQMEAKRKEREAAAAAKAAEKAAEKEAKEREKAAEREAKEKEKAEKAAEKAAQKEKEREQKDKEKAAKALKAVGFQSTKDLGRSQAVMANFFKSRGNPAAATAGPAAPAAVTAAPAAAAAAAPVSPQAVLRPEQQADSAQGVKGLAMCVGRESGSPVSGEETRMQGERLTAWLEEQAAAIDAAGLPGTDAARAAAADVCAEKARLLPVWKEQARTQRVPLKGAPPTWARKPGPQPSLHERCVAVWGEGYQATAVRIIRRKLIAFSENTRPPYYGSWSRPSVSVRGRRPLSRDISLDYEVDSDEEWEDEPEGTDLEACDSDDEGSELRGGNNGPNGEGGDEDDEAEGFVVDDGYLSGDEGVKLDGDMDLDAAPSGPLAPGVQDPRMAALEAGVTRALRSNRPLLLSQLPNGGMCDPPSALDNRLLKVLAGVNFRPFPAPTEYDIYTPAPPPAAAQKGEERGKANGGAAGDAAGAGADGVNGVCSSADKSNTRRKASFPDTLTPALVAFLQTTKERSFDKVMEGFYMVMGYNPAGVLMPTEQAAAIAAAGDPMVPPPAARPPLPGGVDHACLPQRLPKVVVKDKIKSLATWGGAAKGWVMNPNPGANNNTATPAKSVLPSVLGTQPLSTPHTAPGSQLPGGIGLSLGALTGLPTTLGFNTPASAAGTAAGLLADPPTTGQPSTAGALAAARLASEAAGQLLAGIPGQGLAAQSHHPTGAPTPFPTPGTTFPVPGGSLPLPTGAFYPSGVLPDSAAMAATGADGAAADARQARLWAPLPAGRAAAAAGTPTGALLATPLTPIPCALETAPSLALGGAAAMAMTPAGAAPQVPANTPATVAPAPTIAAAAATQPVPMTIDELEAHPPAPGPSPAPAAAMLPANATPGTGTGVIKASAASAVPMQPMRGVSTTPGTVVVEVTMGQDVKGVAAMDIDGPVQQVGIGENGAA